MRIHFTKGSDIGGGGGIENVVCRGPGVQVEAVESMRLGVERHGCGRQRVDQTGVSSAIGNNSRGIGRSRGKTILIPRIFATGRASVRPAKAVGIAAIPLNEAALLLSRECQFLEQSPEQLDVEVQNVDVKGLP
jgi:hypothetical protein